MKNDIHNEVLDLELAQKPIQEKLALLKGQYLPTGEKILWVGQPKIKLLGTKFVNQRMYDLFHIAQIACVFLVIITSFTEQFGYVILAGIVTYFLNNMEVRHLNAKPIHYCLTPNEFGICLLYTSPSPRDS